MRRGPRLAPISTAAPTIPVQYRLTADERDVLLRMQEARGDKRGIDTFRWFLATYGGFGGSGGGVVSQPDPGGRRFLQLGEVCEVLNISSTQAYALVRSGDLAAIKIGGRGQWRVERSALEDFIARAYVETAEFVRTHLFGAAAEDAGGEPDQE